MFFHPSLVSFFFFLFVSIYMMVSVSSWFFVWFFIEMNLLCFIPLINSKKNKYVTESSLKYFLMQALSSIILMIGIVFMYIGLDFFIFFIIGSLSIKLGVAPFHQWMVNISESFSWMLLFVLLTVQKMGPFILLGYSVVDVNKASILVLFLSFSSALVGALGGLFTSSLRKILVFSSISHNSWMILAVSVSVYTWLVYFLIYVFVFFSVIYLFSSYNVYSLGQLFLKLNSLDLLCGSVFILSLGGLPPLTGFIPKMFLIKEFMGVYNYFVFFFLLASVFISLFFYSRVFVLNFMYMCSKNMALSGTTSKAGFFLFFNLAGFFILPFVCLFS
uniref:NADH-ubiquinone oxidoreductase chain 2 n=1 Tax=Metacrangonyx dhofarensis TaxID=2291046 RepID=A0A345UDJ7_9CRUS|nr:NADH dehydrogenase subunit 2 [Metacrangonyx dhofarensis]